MFLVEPPNDPATIPAIMMLFVTWIVGVLGLVVVVMITSIPIGVILWVIKWIKTNLQKAESRARKELKMKGGRH